MSITIDAQDKLELHSISGFVLHPDHNYIMQLFIIECEVITRGMTFTSAMSVRGYEVIDQVALDGEH